MQNVIEMKNITKRFPGIVANDNVTFELRKGEIHALLGENGAGKSTLMSVLFGMYKADEGEIYRNGEKVTINNPNDANDLGIGMVHQHFKLVEVFSVLDNIIMGIEPTKGGFIKRKETKKKILELCDKYELHINPDAIVEDLTVGAQQRTEILKMLYRENDVLIFDEPTAVLTPQEIDQLMVTMKNLTNEGKSIIFITHKLDEIMAVCDRVTVLRRGKYIGTVDVDKTTKEELSKMMVGRDVEFKIPKKDPVIKEPVLIVDKLSVTSDISKKAVVDNVSFKVNKGEIVCIAGIDGNGQSELGYAISGLMKPKSGNIYLNYENVTHKSIRYRNDHGLSHIPEDRQKYGLILDDTLANNLVLKKYHLNPFQKRGIIQNEPINKLGKKLINDFDIRSGEGLKTKTGSMSGGNQQKAIIAREIDKDSDFILSIQTVRGLDVGAVEFAHKTLIKERDKGKGILLVSFDLEEVFSVSDRILVMYEGKIVKDVLAKDITVEELGLYMAGSKRDGLPESVITTEDQAEIDRVNLKDKVILDSDVALVEEEKYQEDLEKYEVRPARSNPKIRRRSIYKVALEEDRETKEKLEIKKEATRKNQAEEFIKENSLVEENKAELEKTNWWKRLTQKKGFKSFTASILAIIIGLILGILIIVITNPKNSGLGIERLLKGALNNPNGFMSGIGQLLYRATPIIFTGLSVAFAFKTGVFNIGASGQYTMGLFVGAIVGILGNALGVFQWPVALIAGALAGALWGAISGAMRAYFSVNVVISGIMLNYIGMFLVNGLLGGVLKSKMVDGATNRTITVSQTARTPTALLDKVFPHSGIDFGIILAIIVVIIIALILNKTVFGRELKSVGLNRDAAKYAGVNEKKAIIQSMTIAGLLAGIGGALFILAPSRNNLGNQYSLENEVLMAGFDGIPVALLGNSNPVGVFFAALFVGYIKLAGDPLQSIGIASEIVNLIIAVILYFSAFALIVSQVIVRIGKRRKNKKDKEKPDEVKILEDSEVEPEKAAEDKMEVMV